jgi:hypothetical protein
MNVRDAYQRAKKKKEKKDEVRGLELDKFKISRFGARDRVSRRLPCPPQIK